MRRKRCAQRPVQVQTNHSAAQFEKHDRSRGFPNSLEGCLILAPPVSPIVTRWSVLRHAISPTVPASPTPLPICIGRRSCGSEHFPGLRPVRSVRPVPSTSLPSAGSRLVNGAKWPKRSSFPAASPIADPSSAKNAVSSRLFLPAAHHGSDSILALRPPGSHPWIPPAGR